MPVSCCDFDWNLLLFEGVTLHPLTFIVVCTMPFSAVVWVVLALLVGRWTHFPKVILSDERVVRPVLHLAFVGLGINTIMLLYLTVYLPKVKNITDSAAWDVYCPRVVPSMTFVGVITAFLMIRATWPVWGFLAPMVLGLECLGSLFALHFVPWF
jgi:hypothetical protein